MRETDKYIFFWKAIISNWHICKFTVNDVEYNTSEQYFMHQKAMTFHNYDIAQKILQSKNPKEQKALGRKVSGFDYVIWNTIRYKVMLKGNYEKFSQDEFSRKKLLETGNKILVEASPYDIIWGIGLEEDDERILNEREWKGQNLLGKVLMEVREKLRNKENENL